MNRDFYDAVWDRTLCVLYRVCYFLVFFFFLVATFIAFPLRSGFGSCLRFLAAADALFFLPSAYALDLGRHFGLPSFSDPLAHGPLIFPSGPNLTHFCLNHFRRSSFKDSVTISLILMDYFFDLLPQLAAPTFLHFARAPDAYALGQTLYLAFTL